MAPWLAAQLMPSISTEMLPLPSASPDTLPLSNPLSKPNPATPMELWVDAARAGKSGGYAACWSRYASSQGSATGFDAPLSAHYWPLPAASSATQRGQWRVMMRVAKLAAASAWQIS